MPRALQTGSQKKTARLGLKGAREREKVALPLYKQSAQQLKEIAGGKHGIPSDLGEIIKRYERAGRGAEKIFAPIREQAVADFEQYQQPEQVAALGQGTAGSSAMNQAMAAAKGNLQRQLAADFAGLQSNLASNLLSNSQNAKLQNLQARLGASSAGMGGVNPVAANLGIADPYIRTAKGPSTGSQIAGTALEVGGTALGAYFGSPQLGYAAGKAASSSLNRGSQGSTTGIGGSGRSFEMGSGDYSANRDLANARIV